jgi:DNA-binding SARP family transcriptional activator/tetratricopeptide (TPR) repeat protein
VVETRQRRARSLLTEGGFVMQLDYRLLGRFEVRADGRLVDLGTPKQRAVLAILLLECGRVVPTDRLLELLWGDATVSTSSLQSYVSNLRRVLEPDRRPRDPNTVLVTQPPGYLVNADRCAVDVFRFEDLVSEGSERIRAGDTASGLTALDEALAMWGPPLPELADESYVVAAATRLGGLRVTALVVAAQARLDLGDHLGAVGLLEGPVAEHPLDERLHGLLALGLYRAGRQVDALRVVDRVRRALADTVGLDPGPELRSLEADLLAQTPTLDWRPSPEPSPQPAPDPSPPAASAAPPAASAASTARSTGSSGATALVGRQRELATLLDALTSIEAGRGRVAVVMGEPGIGKTRLVEELSEIARTGGAVTATVRCPESGAIPAFWPVVQLADQVHDAGSVSGTFRLPEDTAAEPPSTLFALYEAVTRTLRSTSDPLVLVVDDLQWADADTLRLLAHIAPDLRDAPVFVVVTVRPLDDSQAPALIDCLGELARVSDTVTVHLGGLALDDVAEWLGRRSDVDVPAAVAATVHERTGGNPLFVKELSELLTAEGRIGDADAVLAGRAIPQGVQFVVRRRVARLPAATQQLLSVASVVGRTFSLDVVADVTGEPLDAALDALAPALDAGLVLDEGTADFRFSHALVAEALVAELNATRRARVHAATARALADRAGRDFGQLAALVAHHAVQGRLAGTGELAVQASMEAARRAAERFGYEEAASHWERAVAALEAVRPTDLEARIAALCELAANRFSAEFVRLAKEAALDAMALAHELGDTAALARAAALFGRPHLWPNQAYGEVDHRAVTALERVADELPAHDLVNRALVLGALAMELFYADASRFGPVRHAAVEAARQCGDPYVLARVLINVAGPLRPSELEFREVLAHEVLELSRAHGLPEDVELVGWFHLAIARWDAADFDTALGHVETCRQLAERIGGSAVRAQLTWYRGATALVRGDYDRSLQFGREASELYRRTRGIDADLIEISLLVAHAADRGGLEQIAEQLMAIGHGNYTWLTAAVTGWAMVESGLTDHVREVMSAIDPSVPFPDDYTMLCGAAMALHVFAELGDRVATAALAAQLAPYRGRWTQTGSGGCSAGLVDLALARAAALAGDVESARELFDSAVAGHERLGARAWWARSFVHQGRFLLGTGDPVDAERARAALDRARQLADDHGLVYVQRQVDAVSATR